jgi:teichuronic acid biosynthesis glycosyltransferase TuaH
MTERVILLSTADFHNEIWTNKQYIAAGLSKHMQVIYIESLGLRSPKLTLRDIKRVISRLFSLGRDTRDEAHDRSDTSDLRIVSPRVLPFPGIYLCRRVNQILMSRWIRRLGITDADVLWTFSPITYGLEGAAGKTVYHSVDLLHTLPGIPSKAVLAAERQLMVAADACIASSKVIVEHLRTAANTPIELWENVADTRLFSYVPGMARENRAIFAGHLTPTKVDFECLRSVTAQGVRVAIAGQIAADGSRLSDVDSNFLCDDMVEYLGVLTPAELATEVARSKVGLIPYELNSHTRGIFPMKVYEYLAAGIPVVSTDLESLHGVNIKGLLKAAPDVYGVEVEKAIQDFTE